MSEVEQRPMFVMVGYRRHKSQQVKRMQKSFDGDIFSLYYICKAQIKFFRPFMYIKMFEHTMFLSSFSVNLLAFYHECRSLIGYANHYIFHSVIDSE